MSVYHITSVPTLNEVCLYFDGDCNFSCHGCISNSHPDDVHLDETPRARGNKPLALNEVLSCLQPLIINRVIFLGKEPTVDKDFYPLAKTLKERLNTHNILLTNGWEYAGNEAIDEVCLSIKAITPTLFEDWTGRSGPEQVLENFKRYTTHPKISLRAESLFVPEYIDRDEIGNIARFIAGIDPEIPYRIDGYIPFGIKDRFRRPTQEEMEGVKMVAEEYLQNVSIMYKGVKVKNKVERRY